jgi:hypothetical protein
LYIPNPQIGHAKLGIPQIGHGKPIIIQIVHPIPSTWTWQTFDELFNEKTHDLKKTTHGQHMTTHAWRPLRLFMNMPISSLECCFKIIHGEISKPSYAPFFYYTFTNNNQLKKNVKLTNNENKTK